MTQKITKTKEKFIELIKKNNHELLSEYVNVTTKVLIDFKCGHDPHWIAPYSYKRGRGCPKCSRKCSIQAKEELMNMLKENKHELLSEYVNIKTKVLIDFKCGHAPHWMTPHNYRNGHRCPRCPRNSEKLIQAKEDFMIILEESNHKLLSEYVNNRTKVLIDFNCGHEPHWVIPNNYKNGNGCPKCSGCCPIQAKEDFMNILEENNHKLLSEYKNTATKVLIDYNCGHEPNWITPNNYKNGKRCPVCNKRYSKAKTEFMNILEKNNHKLLSEYKNNRTKVLIDYNCEHEPYWKTPYYYKRNTKCPQCKK